VILRIDSPDRTAVRRTASFLRYQRSW